MLSNLKPAIIDNIEPVLNSVLNACGNVTWQDALVIVKFEGRYNVAKRRIIIAASLDNDST